MTQRAVTTPQFWAALERALPNDHQPNWHQFAAYELGEILAVFRFRWDELARLYPDREDYRVHTGAGPLGAWTVEAQWSARHSEVQLVSIVVDLWPPDMFDEPSVDS